MADKTSPAAPAGKQKKNKPLSTREAEFVRWKVAGKTDAEAARLAGYSPIYIGKGIVQNDPRVSEAIAEGRRKLEVSTDVTMQRTLNELARVGFSTIKNFVRTNEAGDVYLDFSAMTDDDWAAIQEITVEERTIGRDDNAQKVTRTKAKLWSKMDALNTIAKHLGMLSDKVEVTHRYEQMDRRELAEKRTVLSERLSEIRAKLKDMGIDPTDPPTSPSTRTLQ